MIEDLRTKQSPVIIRPDTAGNMTGINYDAWGRVTSVAHPDTSTIGVVYNLESMVTSVTNELSKTSSAEYDDVGQVIATTNAKSESQTYSYNQNGWLLSVTNARNYARNYTYTPRGEVASLTLPDNSVEAWSYNANGELTAYTNPLNQVIGYVYDNAGRLITVDYPTGTDTTLSYDNANRTTQMSDATGNTAWTYDAASRVTSLATPQGTQTYSYDNAGRRISMTEPGSAVTNYAYDAFGRLQTITNPFSEVTNFVYDNAGRVSSKQVASNAYETYSYDNRNRVTNIAVKEQQGAVINSEAYTFDATSNVLTHSQNGLATTYGYDNIGQLITESKPNYLASYSYDSNGNRLTRTVNGTTEDYAYDGADKLETVKVGGTNIKSFGYDGAGRTTSIVTSAGTTSLTYDFEGRVTGITYHNTSTNSFSYNGLDSRVGAVDSQGSKTFRRDGVGVTAPLLADGLASYTPGISERRNGTTKYLHGGLKNKSAQTTTNQTVAATKSYDAFGNILTSTGTWSGNSNYGGNFGYQTDPDSGLKLLGHRYYDSSIGRFITRDPAKDGRNWYSYCENNPTTKTDPNGLSMMGIASLIYTIDPHLVTGPKGGRKKVVIIQGDMRGDGSKKSPDLSGYFEDILGDYFLEYAADLVLIIKNERLAIKHLSDADIMIWVGHHGPYNATLATVVEGDMLIPSVIRNARGGRLFEKIELVGCDTLIHGQEWADLVQGGNLWGANGRFDVRGYSYGAPWPWARLQKWDPKNTGR